MAKNKHIENEEQFKGLSVNEGIPQPPPVNIDAINRFKNKKRKTYSVSDYVEGIIKSDRTILSQAITLIESSLHEHQMLSQEIIEKCLPHTGNSIRIGITGVPGVGKSTFIESLGLHVIGQQKKLAVLAIDPSSERSKGSILGDKTRMEQLVSENNAYIRPSPSAGSLGGVARKTRESIVLCEAAGFDTIFIETVGVGQSETAVHSMVDFFLLLMLSGAGDELQGIKRGIMEMADAIAINKADGDNQKRANLAKSEYQNALHLFPATESNWIPQVLTCSAMNHIGINDIWNMIMDYKTMTVKNGYFNKRRRGQATYWMHESINDSLKEHFYTHQKVQKQITKLEKKVLEGNMSSFIAANELLSNYFSSF